MVEVTHIGQLVPDPKNARKHNPRNIGVIVDALHEVDAARSIVLDENNVILAGNGVIEAAAEAGIERVQVVDADGNTIIAVRRTGLSEAQKARLALFDNRAAELAEWEPGVLAGFAEDGLLGGMFSDLEVADILGKAADELLTQDAAAQTVPEQYMVLIECDGENQQSDLLQRLTDEGYKCRALLS